LICCPLGYNSSLTQLHPHTIWLRLWGLGLFVESNDVFLHGWGWQPPQTVSHIHIRHIQSAWAHWYAVHGDTIAALHSHTHSLPTLLGSDVWVHWVTCGVKMMSLPHGWGLQPPQTASPFHFRQKKTVWAYWYAVHGDTLAALHSYTPTLIGSDFVVLGHLLSWNDVITSWLRLTATSNCVLHPY